MNILNFFKRISNSKSKVIIDRSSERSTYSQTGEDVIVKFIFEQLKITNPSYLDLGAHHPTFLNNTYIFYKSGSRGVNVEPDPFLINDFNIRRPDDINLNIGVGFDKTAILADFFVMSEKVLNTFSREEAEKIEAYGSYKISEILKIQLLPLPEILSHFESNYPNFVTLDVEGLDYEIVKTFDFDTCRPEVFCIETITYTEDKSEEKIQKIIDFMISKEYFVFADTYINTIFVDKKAWAGR